MDYRFSERTEKLSPSLIRQMYNFALEDISGFVSLGVGVPSFPLPEHISRGLADKLRYDPNINKYALGRGLSELNSEFAKKLKRKGIEIDSEREVLTTTGSAGGIFCTLMALVAEGDEVIIPDPAYSNHIECVRFAGGIRIHTPLIENEEWRLDTEAIKNSIGNKTKAIVLCNPSNPTGAVFPEEDLRKVGEIARSNGLYLLEDNAYEFLTFDGRDHFSLQSVSRDRDNVISFFTPSKEHAMTGFRVGWVVAHPKVIDKVFAVQDQNYICAPSISQHAALVALQGPQDHVNGFREELARRREVMCQGLDNLAEFLNYQRPHGAYYVFPRIIRSRDTEINENAKRRLKEIPERFRTRDTELALDLLYEAGVVTVPGISFGPAGENHLRLSFAGEESDIQEAFDRINNWLRS